MTNPPPPVTPGYVRIGAPPPGRRKGLPALAIVGIVVAAFCVAGSLIVTVAVIANSSNMPASQANADGRATATTTAPAPAPVAKETYYEPQPADFQLAVKILEKQCFGSAGCNIQFRIELTYVGAGKLDPATTYEVTYEIKGGEDPLINTLKVTGSQYQYDERELIGTKSSKAELTAVVTNVSAR